ncbi:MAG: 2-phospho-L-lactate guanylyltransferase [Xanthobacteraceae bacterium]
MTKQREIWALLPVKDTALAKQRLGEAVPPQLRQGFTLAMLEDVLQAVSAARGIARIIVITTDPAAARIALAYDARILTEGARMGHTGAIRAAAQILAQEGCDGFLQLPLDIPTVTADEVTFLVKQHEEGPAFTIAPSHDEQGSNAVLVSPPDAVPLTFGEDSFYPHLRTAERLGIPTRVVRLPGFALDIDRPEDLAAFARLGSNTRAHRYLESNGLVPQHRFEQHGAA